MTSVKRIESRFVKENHLLGLGFPGQGYLFFRCTGVEPIRYKYTEVSSTAGDGVMTADEFVDSARLSSDQIASSVDNVLRITDCLHMYQTFIGWRPGAVRQYLYLPYDTPRRNLDVRSIYSKSPFGYIDGFESPFDCPSPDTELFIPKNLDVGFAWHNPTDATITLELNLLIRRLSVDLIRDVDLISRIISGAQPCRLVTVGGVGSQFSYQSVDIYDIEFVNLGSTREEIQKAVA